MSQSVNRARTYESPRRRAQAQATRRAILEAAQRLFQEHGYGATSVPAIAELAEVSLKTVYVVFETKAKLLRSLWEERLGGEEADLAVTERAWYRELLEETEAQRQVALLAAQSRAVKTRSGVLMEVIRNAASADPEIAHLWDDIQTKLHEVSRSIVQHWERKQALHHDLDVNTASDLLWTLNHPSVWKLLVIERGWSESQYEKWLRDAITSQLLMDDRN
ncbi:MAG: TetR/AcrR family transcriptional regulator [Actinomycetota bacterium]|nr:TetR/AcrR family transcriptional regulator [Actinomycetota bacterium]